MANRRTLKEVEKLIRRLTVTLVISTIVLVLGGFSSGYLCHTDTVPSCLSDPNGLLATTPLLTLVAIIIFAGISCVFLTAALLDIPDRWENGDM